MPKIIENLPQRLQEEARRQIELAGFAAMTIRSVAKGCGVGVGTVYNYFPSKEALVAGFMLDDWKSCVAAIDAAAEAATELAPVLQVIYDQITLFLDKYDLIFGDPAAALSYTGSSSRYHSILRAQLAAPLRKFCRDDFTAEFLAESMLTWTVASKEFDDLKGVLLRIN